MFHKIKPADLIKETTHSELKFCAFLLAYMPNPPDIKSPADGRPSQLLLKWKNSKILEALRIIYDCRSKALHNGIPFPVDMCKSPIFGKYIVEKPPYHPMYIQTFEYIVKNALLQWFDSMVHQN